MKLEHIFPANKMNRNLFVLCKCSLKNLIFYFMFVRTVEIILMLHLPCVDLMVHSTNRLLTGWLIQFDWSCSRYSSTGRYSEGDKIYISIFFIFLHKFTFLYLLLILIWPLVSNFWYRQELLWKTIRFNKIKKNILETIQKTC